MTLVIGVKRPELKTKNTTWRAASSDVPLSDEKRWRLVESAAATIHGIGRRDILSQPIIGLICSVQCPGSIVIKTFDAIRELRDASIVVAGGFHSPMEEECRDFLLRGDQP